MPVSEVTRQKNLARAKAAYAADPSIVIARAKAWYAANKERAKASSRAWYAANKQRAQARNRRVDVLKKAAVRSNLHYHANIETIRPKRKAYRDSHKEEQAILGKAWYAANKQRARKLAKSWYLANTEQHRAYGKRYRSSHPEEHRAEWQAYRARLRQATGKFTGQDIRRQFELQFGLCFYCKIEMHDRWTIDHYIPLIRGGTNNRENIVLACLRCNCSKRGLMPEDFMATLAEKKRTT